MTLRYSLPLRVVHHITAACFLGALFVVLFAEDLGMPEGQAIGLHKSLGVSVLLLLVLRVVARLSAPVPAPVRAPALLRYVSAAVHWALYGLMVAIPVAGWLKSNTKGYGVDWFGVFSLPTIAATNQEANHFWSETHELLGYTGLALVALHLVGVLYHQFIVKDGTLRRMW